MVQVFKARSLAVLAAVALPVASFAQTTGAGSTFDVSTYTSTVGGLIAGFVLLGGAVFGINLGIKSTKWARKAL